jgi:short-subunit dehydrogenase
VTSARRFSADTSWGPLQGGHRPIPATVPALVTGASSGLGETFARHLARRGHELVLVARRVDRLERLATELRALSGMTVEVLGADLETAAGRGQVVDRLSGDSPWLLVNSAGFGTRGRFVDQVGHREASEVTLNCLGVHELMRAALTGCVAARGGGVINLASTASFQPIPHMATYAATKAFVLHLTEAVATELRGSGVRVMALCPGPTRTGFGGVAGMHEDFERLGPLYMSADRVVATGLRAFDRGDVICVPGLFNLASAMSLRMVPRFMVQAMLAPVFANSEPGLRDETESTNRPTPRSTRAVAQETRGECSQSPNRTMRSPSTSSPPR